jgi:hypothetical protein
VTTELTRAGAQDCTDSEPLHGEGSVTLGFSARGVRARYETTNNTSGFDPLRTRCPGPGIGDVAGTRGLATALVPRSAFRRRSVTLRLFRGAAYSADGYTGRTQSDLTVVLRRTRIRQHVQVVREPQFRPLLSRRLP